MTTNNFTNLHSVSYPEPSATLNLPFPVSGLEPLDSAVLQRATPRLSLPGCLHGLVGRRREDAGRADRRHICEPFSRVLDHAVVFGPKGNRSKYELLLLADVYTDEGEDLQSIVDAYCARFEILADLQGFVLPSWRGNLILFAHAFSDAASYGRITAAASR